MINDENDISCPICGSLTLRRNVLEYDSQTSSMTPGTDTELLNWLEQNPHENLQAVEWQLTHGKAKNIRESAEYHLRRGL